MPSRRPSRSRTSFRWRSSTSSAIRIWPRKYSAESVPQTYADEVLIAQGAQPEELFALSLEKMEPADPLHPRQRRGTGGNRSGHRGRRACRAHRRDLCRQERAERGGGGKGGPGRPGGHHAGGGELPGIHPGGRKGPGGFHGESCPRVRADLPGGRGAGTSNRGVPHGGHHHPPAVSNKGRAPRNGGQPTGTWGFPGRPAWQAGESATAAPATGPSSRAGRWSWWGAGTAP